MTVKSTIKALLVSLLLATPAAQAVVLTFDDIGAVHGTIIDTDYAGVTISAVNNDYTVSNSVPNLAVAFNTNVLASATSDDDLLAAFENINNPLLGPASPNNVLIIQENDSGCGDDVCDDPDDEGSRNAGSANPGAGHFLFEFDKPVKLISLDFFDIENFAGNDENNGVAGSEIRFYDEFGVEIFLGASVFTPGTGGDIDGPNGVNTWDRLMFAGITGIYGLEVNLYGSGAIDNLEYNVVPVPAAFWLFGTALLGFIGISRRRTI